MKQITISILIALFFGQWVMAEVVPISDSNFKKCLVKSLPQLLDENQNLVVEAAQVYNGTLNCADSNIDSVPELIYFESLTVLELNLNNLTHLPSLDHLSQLTYLYIAENQLTKLPSLDSLLNLEQLICWKNKLTELPDLRNLDKLHRLDVPVNKLTKFPELSPKAPMQILLVDDNYIEDLPDLSQYPLLQIVKVVNNRMSFGDLSVILKQPNPEIYDYYPQKSFPVLESKTLKEGETLELLSRLDNFSSKTNVKWYRDNAFVANNDILIIAPVAEIDQGIYNAVLTSELFPNKPLYTNAVQIQVLPCPKIADFKVEIKNADCTTPGNITIQAKYDIEYKYTLEGAKYKQTELSGVIFENLKPQDYHLEITAPNGCSVISDTALIVNSTACENVLFSPNGDGFQDEYFFDQKGKGVIVDKFGNLIREVDLPFIWDGSDENQTKIPQGYYILNINQGESLIGVTIVY